MTATKTDMKKTKIPKKMIEFFEDILLGEDSTEPVFFQTGSHAEASTCRAELCKLAEAEGFGPAPFMTFPDPGTEIQGRRFIFLSPRSKEELYQE